MLPRQRLVQMISGHRSAWLVVLQGPAGLGKSVLLDELARRVGAGRVVRVNSDDELARYADAAPPDEPPAWLLIDGLKEPSTDALQAAMTSAREAGGRVVVASRMPLPGVTTAMQLGGNVHIVSVDELLFTKDEVARLAARHKLEIAADEIAALHHATQGWPAMVDAALRRYEPGAQVVDRRLRELIDGFIREEVLGSIPAEDVERLMHAAAVPTFDVSVLSALLPERTGEGPMELISRWARAGWIVYGSSEGHWRIPLPLRQTLVTDLEFAYPGRRARLVTASARMLIDDGRSMEALPYLVDASLDDAVAALLRERWGDDVAPHGRFAEAGPALRSLGEGALGDDPGLRLITAVSALRPPPDIDTFELRLAETDSVLDHTSFNSPLITFHSLSMMLARIRGDIERTTELERSGQALIDAASDEQRQAHVNRVTYFRYQVGVTRLAEGRLSDAEQALRSARTTARNNHGDWYAAISDMSIAYASLLAGNLTTAQRDTDSVRAYAHAQADPLLANHSHLLDALLQLEYGRTWNVRGMLARAQSLLDLDAEPPLARLALAWSTLASLADDATAAEQALLLSDDHHPVGQLPLSRLLRGVARAQAHLAQDDPSAALAALDTVTPPPGHGLLAVTRARAHLAMNDPVAAIAELAPHRERGEELSLTVRADVLALTAEAELRLGRDARVPFSRLLAILERTGAIRPVLAAPRLCDAVSAGKLSTPPSSPLAGLGTEIAALTQANRGAAPRLSERESELLTALGASATLGEIAKRMYVSANTLKTTARALYRKLGVANRHEAVRVARTLGLLPPDTPLP